ncbi:MAG TPA: LamG domain-containing protein [Pirellulales bacterium]|nr:LamG domain-containing protein [Pirellulales bacterium]
MRLRNVIAAFVVATLSLPLASTHAAIIDGLINYYPFDTDADDNAGTNDGTLENGATIDNVTTQVGAGSLFLDNVGAGAGPHEYVSRAGVTSGPQPTYSVAAWINVGSNSGDDQIMSWSKNPSGENLQLRLQGGNLRLGRTPGFSEQTTSGHPFLLSSTWRHIAVTFDEGAGTEVFLYVDGVERGSGDLTNTSSNDYNTSYIGAIREGGTVSRSFEGNIDDLGIWDRVLTPAEVTGLFDGSLSLAAVPEPSTFVLGVCGLLGLLASGRRRNRRRA